METDSELDLDDPFVYELYHLFGAVANTNYAIGVSDEGNYNGGLDFDNEVKEALKLITVWADARAERRAVEKIRQLLSDANDELGHERSYVNNAKNIEYYEHVVDYLSKRYELKRAALTQGKEKDNG